MGESVALCELQESPSSVVCLSNAKSPYCPCLVVACVREYATSISFLGVCYDRNVRPPRLLVEMFDLLVFVV